MTMTHPPRCCSGPGPCPVGCYDDVHVRGLARRLVDSIYRYLRLPEGHGHKMRAWSIMHDAAYDYWQAARDQRSERAWPGFTFPGGDDHPCDPGGWCVNANETDMARLAAKLRGPIVAELRRHPDGRLTVAEVATFRLPPPRLASST